MPSLRRLLPARLAGLVAILSMAGAARAGARFDVSFPEAARKEPATGRLVIYLAGPDLPLDRRYQPAHGDRVFDKQPILGRDVVKLAPGAVATVDGTSDWFLRSAATLEPGRWLAQAVLDTKHETSAWHEEAGNLVGRPVAFTVRRGGGGDTVVKLTLDRATVGTPFEDRDGVEFVAVRSASLSKFAGRDVVLRAGVVKPTGFDAGRRYAAVYEIPGFGGRATSAFAAARRRATGAPGADAPGHKVLAGQTFWIVLDPESPNGHTLFVDSDVNGPWASALVGELIPVIETKYPQLVRTPAARMLRGHSSGGWASLWLATQHPQTFGAAWATAPDPVDFRALQRINLYADAGAFARDGAELPSVRDVGSGTQDAVLTVREENAQERVLGPNNTSAGQWDSWQAAWGTRRPDGWPKPVFDKVSGTIDRAEAKRYERFDLRLLLSKDPARYRPIWRDRIRLVVGADDNYFLNEAVVLLKRELDAQPAPAGSAGYVVVAPGLDHSTIADAEAVERFPAEMERHLQASGALK